MKRVSEYYQNLKNKIPEGAPPEISEEPYPEDPTISGAPKEVFSGGCVAPASLTNFADYLLYEKIFIIVVIGFILRHVIDVLLTMPQAQNYLFLGIMLYLTMFLVSSSALGDVVG